MPVSRPAVNKRTDSPAPACSSPDGTGWLSETVGTGVRVLVAKRYRLGPSLGRGGMGEVFRATDELLGRPVAVKLLLPSDRDPRAGERFHREARAAARLNDPHVVAVFDFGDHGDGFFLVMELVEGRTVADELGQHGPLPKDRAIDIVEQAAAGLAAAHREDVVHRDVKPGNLLLAADGTVKVADFGIAHLPGEGATTLTGAGQIIGSTHYLAPERAKGGQAGQPSDVYSLGCVLYQLVTGRPPFTAEHPTAVLYQHVDTAPAPPSLIRPELGGPFELVLLQMLAKDATDRPTAAEIAAGSLRVQPGGEDLAGVGAVPAVGALPAVGAVTAEPGAGPIVATSPLEALESPNRARRKLLAGGIAVLATAAAAVAAVLLDGNETRLPPTTDVGPQPGVSPSTPASNPATTRTQSTTGPTQAAPADPITSAQPSQSASPQVTPPTPSPSTAPTGTTSPGTPSPSAPSQSSTTPSAPTEGTPSTEPSPSSTPPSETPPASTPATGTPSPGAQGNETSPAAD